MSGEWIQRLALAFAGGMLFGIWLNGKVMGLYRRWYLMVRNELERLDPTNPALRKIGERTSPKEPWE